MLVRPKSKKWLNKLMACKNLTERYELIISSGTEKYSTRLDLKTSKVFYAPRIGAFDLISRDENSEEYRCYIPDQAISISDKLRLEILKYLANPE